MVKALDSAVGAVQPGPNQGLRSCACSLSTGRPGAGNLVGSCPCPAVLFAASFSGRPCGAGSFHPCPAGLAQEFGQSRRRRQLSRYLRQVARVRVAGCGLSHPLREPFCSSSIMPEVERPDPRSSRCEVFRRTLYLEIEQPLGGMLWQGFSPAVEWKRSCRFGHAMSVRWMREGSRSCMGISDLFA